MSEPGNDADSPAVVIDDPRFQAFFVQHYGRVLAYGLRRVEDRAAAEDIAAETFLIAWRQRARLPEDPLPWLLATARNLVSNERRARTRRLDLLERVRREPVLDQPAEDESYFIDPPVRRALASLRPSDREVLMLTSWDGLDAARAAAVLGCSPNAFAVRLHRARKRLATALDTQTTTSQEPHR